MILRLFSLSLFLINLGCSAYSQSTHFQAIPREGLVETEIYDHLSIDKASWGWGKMAPPAYSHFYSNEAFILYPIDMEDRWGLLGVTPVIPFLPLSWFDQRTENEQAYDLRWKKVLVRHHSLEGSLNTIPIAIRFDSTNALELIYPFRKKSSDAVGDLYEAEVPTNVLLGESVSAVVKLSDQTDFKISYKRVETYIYNVVNAFNGPSPRPKVKFLRSLSH